MSPRRDASVVNKIFTSAARSFRVCRFEERQLIQRLVHFRKLPGNPAKSRIEQVNSPVIFCIPWILRFRNTVRRLYIVLTVAKFNYIAEIRSGSIVGDKGVRKTGLRTADALASDFISNVFTVSVGTDFAGSTRIFCLSRISALIKRGVTHRKMLRKIYSVRDVVNYLLPLHLGLVW